MSPTAAADATAGPAVYQTDDEEKENYERVRQPPPPLAAPSPRVPVTASAAWPLVEADYAVLDPPV